MIPQTYFNQKIIQIHRNQVQKNTENPYLCIYYEHMMEACRTLSNSAFKVYMYLVSNRDNYMFALSPADIRNQTGVCLDTVRKALRELENRGYIVQNKGNMCDFYENRVVDKKEILKKITTSSPSSYSWMY